MDSIAVYDADSHPMVCEVASAGLVMRPFSAIR